MSSINLNVISTSSNGLRLTNGPIVKDSTKELSGRFFLNNNWTCATGWNYLPGGTVQLANDVPPSINALVASTNSTSQITFNTSNGLINFPFAGKVRLNAWTTTTADATTSNNYELRLSCYASPAWSVIGQSAKTYGVGASVAALAGNVSATLKKQNLVTVGIESGIDWTGVVSAGTQIALLVYSGSGQTAFANGGIFVEAGYDYLLN